MNTEDAVHTILANWPRHRDNLLQWILALAETPPAESSLFPDARRVRCPQLGLWESERRSYVLTSLFLRKCHAKLTRRPPEDIHLTAGFRLSGAFVLDEMVALPRAQRAMHGAFANPGEVRRALVLMERYGLICAGLFHSHPGYGAQSTRPSQTDLENHTSWEKAFPLLGAIFSQDGFVRFFQAARQPRVLVIGKKAKKIDECLYQLTC